MILLNAINKRNLRSLHTIYALSSGFGKCGVAVIRVSGNAAGHALKQLTNLKQLPMPRYALLKNICHPKSREVLDKGLVVWFPGPKSFTGEDSCEFQVHGGLAVITSILNALQLVPNLRPAEPGEFTRRAFHNGKLDLTGVEGLADLLQAETEMQRRQAFLQTEGALKNLYDKWRATLLKSVANIEAFIDFEETESLEENFLQNTTKQLKELNKEMLQHLKMGQQGEILRNGIKTVFIGEPNAGKSSLFNILCDRPAAIVTPVPGTTRDVLQTTLDINGYPLVLMDTAGLRHTTQDPIELEGIKRAFNSISDANLIILIIDATKFKSHHNLNSSLDEYILNLGLKITNQKLLTVLNKIDLLNENEIKKMSTKNVIALSCKTKTGFPNFIHNLTSHLKELCGTPSKDHPCMNKERHRYLVESCTEYLKKFLNESKNEEIDVVILAQYLRSSLRQIGKLTGNITTEDLLDVIFKDFCIGK